MIQKITSKDMMDILSKSQEKVEDMNKEILSIKNELETRLQVIQNAQNFLLQQTQLINSNLEDGYNEKLSNKIVFATADIQEGTYDIYGTTILPRSIKTANNIFNLNSETGAIFKNNAIVKINDTIDNKFKDMLMLDSIIGKGVSFAEFDTDEILLEVAVNPHDLLGSTNFNVIEILPYIPGSLTLKKVDVYDMQGYQTDEIFPALTVQYDIDNLGAMKFLIDKVRTLYKLELTFKINYRNPAGKYPFGLKHLYLLKENFDTDSYAVVKMKNNNYIRSIGEKIIVTDQNGSYESTVQQEGIKIFISYLSGNLSHEMDISSGFVENIIPQNIKEFYVQLPIDRSIISINFLEIRTK